MDEVVPPEHIARCLGKSRTVSFVRVTWKPLLFCAHQPPNLVSVRLTTKQAGEIGWFPSLIFVKKVALIHRLSILAGFALQLHSHLRTWTPSGGASDAGAILCRHLAIPQTRDHRFNTELTHTSGKQ